jgi:transposase
VTRVDVTYQRRVAAIAHAAEIGDISEAARVFGVARQTLSEWMSIAGRCGLSALVPKGRRRPQQPNEMAVWEIETILAEAVARPHTGRAGRLLEHLAEREVHRSKSGVQKVLGRYNTRRPNRGQWMRGRTPAQLIQSTQRAEPSPQPVVPTR